MTKSRSEVVAIDDPSEWDRVVLSATDRNVFQSAGWGDHRRHAGWEPLRLVGRDAAGVAISAQVLARRLPLGIVVAWSPGGPLVGHRAAEPGALGSWWSRLLTGLAQRAAVTYVRFDCHHPVDPTVAAAATLAALRRPLQRINTALTTVVRLDRSVDVVVQAMRKEHRRELRRSEAAGLRWRSGRDPSLVRELIALRSDMLAAKDLRARRLPSATELEGLTRRIGDARVVVGYLGDEPVTAALILAAGDRAILHTMASNVSGRDLSASYELIVRALELLAQDHVAELDLGGLASATHRRGVDLFKMGFGGEVRSRIGEWEWSTTPGLRLAVNAAIALRGPAIGA